MPSGRPGTADGRMRPRRRSVRRDARWMARWMARWVVRWVVRWVRPRLGALAGVAVLGLLVVRLGSRPFLDAFRLVDAPTLLAAVVLGAVSTTACAWRWTLVARRAGLELAAGPAVAGYFRAVLLNAVLPGGVLGDVHRAVRHGRGTGDVRAAAVAVFGERAVGQVVLAVAALGALVVEPRVLPLPVPAWAVLAAAVVAVALLVVVTVRWSGVLAVVASVLAVACFAGTFLLAAHAAGVTAGAGTLLPLVLVALFATALPLNVGGWGPREGATAWAFATAGLGAAQGVTTSVIYGICAFVAALPGVVVLVASRRGAARAAPDAAAGITVVDLAPELPVREGAR